MWGGGGKGEGGVPILPPLRQEAGGERGKGPVQWASREEGRESSPRRETEAALTSSHGAANAWGRRRKAKF